MDLMNSFSSSLFDDAHRPMPFTPLTDVLGDSVDIHSVDDSGSSPLFYAAQQGDVIKVQNLIDQNAFINKANYQCEYPLSVAIKNKHENIALLLIENRVNLLLKDKEGYTAPMLAARYNMKKVMQLIIKDYPYTLHAVCPKGQNALMIAKEAGHTEIVDLFNKRDTQAGIYIDLDPQIDSEMPWTLNAEAEQQQKPSTQKIGRSKVTLPKKVTIPVILPDSSKEKISQESTLSEAQVFLNQALKHAVENEFSSLIKGFLDMGADPNCTYEDDSTPLSLCALNKNLDCFEILRSNGASIKERLNMHAAVYFENIPMMNKLMKLEPDTFNILDIKERASKRTFNPLYMAIIFKSTKILNHLFTENPKNIIDKMITQCLPLHYAVFYHKYQSVETLLKFMHANQISPKKDTPLMLMAKIPHNKNMPNLEAKLVEIANLLIPRGANVNAVSKDGQTAFEIALDNNKPIFAKRLGEVKRSTLTFKFSTKPGSKNEVDANSAQLNQKRNQQCANK